MPSLRPVLLAAVLFALMLGGSGAVAQKTVIKKPAPPKLTPAETAFYDAVGLQYSQKVTAARDRMKEATRLAPRNNDYKEYLTELNALVEQDALDKHALDTPGDVENDLEKLARHLTAAARSDRDKVRLIFRWVTDRITYDVDIFTTGKVGDTSPEAVLKSRRSVCEGYARLFEKLGKLAGLEVVKVRGYAKGAGFNPGDSFQKDSLAHAWNAVKIDSEWKLLDATWAAGAVNGGKYEKRFNEFYYLTPPEQLAFSHFPREKEWTLLKEEPYTEEDFKRWPKIDYRLFQMGFSAADVRKQLQAKPDAKWLDTFTNVGTKVTILEAPLERRLSAGTKYKLRFKARGFQDLVLINSNDPKWTPVTKKGDVYEVTFSGKPGDLSLSGKLAHRDGRYWGILRWTFD
jgi:transglutaminase-like putative cysteine protease